MIKVNELDVSKFETKNVKKISKMFYKCEKLTNLDVSNFNLKGVNDISYLFGGCSGLTSLSLTNFITTEVTNNKSKIFNLFRYFHFHNRKS